jgi:hypothetical protein
MESTADTLLQAGVAVPTQTVLLLSAAAAVSSRTGRCLSAAAAAGSVSRTAEYATDPSTSFPQQQAASITAAAQFYTGLHTAFRHSLACVKILYLHWAAHSSNAPTVLAAGADVAARRNTGTSVLQAVVLPSCTTPTQQEALALLAHVAAKSGLLRAQMARRL